MNFARSVQASADDATRNFAGTLFSTTTTTLRVDSSGAPTGQWAAGVRFDEVDIPKGIVVRVATITLDLLAASGDDANLDIYCQAADDGLDFVNDGTIYRERSVEDGTPWVADDLGDGLAVSPNFSFHVQKVIDRDGWAARNALVVLLQGRDDAEKVFRPASFDHATLRAPRLHVVYQNIPIQAFRHGNAAPRGILR